MEWRFGLKPWNGVLEWILEWNEVRFGFIVALLGQDLVLIDQFLLNAYFHGALLHFIPFVSFALCRSHASYLFHNRKTNVGFSNPHPALYI